jgi:FkbM family methyltransferase
MPDPVPAAASDPIDIPPPNRLVGSRHGPFLVNANDAYVGRSLLVYGEFSEAECALLVDLAGRCTGSVVEIGANIGALTVPLARAVAPYGRRVLAFEPQPLVFHLLCANVALNTLANVSTWPYAAAARSSIVGFAPPDYSQPGNFGGISMMRDPPPAGVERVRAIKLDDALANEPLGLLKVDVEGFELDVLRGAARLLATRRPAVYIENDRAEHSRDLIEALRAAGYALWWHFAPLFNPRNHFGVAENLFGRQLSINMLALPSEVGPCPYPLPPVGDSRRHPSLEGWDLPLP